MLVCSLLAAGIAAAPALAADAQLVPAAILLVNSRHCIIVEKNAQKLYLYQTDGDQVSLIKTYRCSTGKNHGDKSLSGDQRTPEGVYYFTRKLCDEQLEARYGVMAFVLDFPNRLDKVEARQGNGIWLHGLDKPLQPFDSKGCVALENRDIVELSSYIKLFDTPIVIEERLTMAGPDEMRRKRAEALELLEGWQQSWVAKRVDAYMACYSRDALGAAAWDHLRGQKEALSEKYKFIDVVLHNLNLVQHKDTVQVAFMQDYQSESFQSMGMKRLYLRHNSDTLKIVAEEWRPLPPAHLAQPEAASERRSISRMLNAWITAWEQGRLADYMGCYAPAFMSQGKDRDAWKQYKADLIAKSRRIRIGVSNPHIAIDGDTATVCFVQQYESKGHTDCGQKTLELVKEVAGWKIVREEWQQL